MFCYNQAPHSGKDEIQAKDEKTFLNSVSLLCEVFEQMRLADGTVINVLAVPILEYCDLLLSSQSHAALNLLGRQLQVGRHVAMFDSINLRVQ